jgi:hypothetical protein
MIQQHLTPWNVSEQHQFCPDFDGNMLTFLPATAQKGACTDRDEESGAGLTLQHHSLDSYGGHGMVQQHLTLWNVSKQHQFCPDFDGEVLNFLPATAQKGAWTDRDGQSGAGFDIGTSLIGLIWRTWNGPAASHSVECLRTASVNHVVKEE